MYVVSSQTYKNIQVKKHTVSKIYLSDKFDYVSDCSYSPLVDLLSTYKTNKSSRKILVIITKKLFLRYF